MAYKENWDPSHKATKQELREVLMSIAPDLTDNRFVITFASDDGGHHAVIVSERDPDSEQSPFKNSSVLPSGFMGWRVLRLHVPHGYIPVFYNQDGTRTVTKSND